MDAIIGWSRYAAVQRSRRRDRAAGAETASTSPLFTLFADDDDGSAGVPSIE